LVLVPTAVIGELDGLKRSTDSKKAGATRTASRTLDYLGYSQNIAFGAITSAGSVVRILNRFMKVDDLASSADNRIVGSAIRLQMENKHYNVVLITNDRNMRSIARSYGIRSERYPLRIDVADNGIMNGISDVALASNRKVA
jgi:predicted ribonuclease YlaK